jgi:ATP-dependent Zn protease
VFSAIHMIFSSLLMEVTFWMIEEGHDSVALHMEGEAVAATSGDVKATFKVDMRLSEQRAQITDDFRTMVAVHEAGHSIVYAMLHKAAPFEVKVNVASFTGGYMSTTVPSPYKIETRESMRAALSVLLAGRCAEEIVFGNDNASSGAESDITQATNNASAYVRKYGFDKYTGRVDSGKSERINWITKIEETDESVIALLKSAYLRAIDVLKMNIPYFKVIVHELLAQGSISQQEFIKLSEPFVALGVKEAIPSHEHAWEKFCKHS